MHRNLVLLFLGLLPCVNGLWALVEKTVLVHYMPWFSIKTENQDWGWHCRNQESPLKQNANARPSLCSLNSFYRDVS